jgi:putative addiction module antidote
MPVDFERTLGKVGNSLRIVIPTEIVDALRLKHGDILLINTTDHEIRMKKKEK